MRQASVSVDKITGDRFLWEALWDNVEVQESVNASGPYPGTTRVYASFQTLSCHVIWSVWLLNPLLLRFHTILHPNLSLSSNADHILELQTSDMLKLYEFHSFCTESVCMGDKNTICASHPLLISCIYCNLGCKWMSSDFSHHGWLGLSGALPPSLFEPMKENCIKNGKQMRGGWAGCSHSEAPKP